MANITHRVGIKAPVSKVYAALSTIDGLANWWTQETTGSAKKGEIIEFKFRSDDGSIKGGFGMQVQEDSPNQFIKWQCKEGPADWVGTDLSFQISQAGDYTIVIFAHNNWKEASESMAHCSTKWATFLLSLRDYVETGRGKPAPNDLKIDNWN